MSLENLLTMVDGTKTVILWSPEEAEDLYVGEASRPGISPVDQHEVDMELFPRFARAAAKKATLQPGDTLYIPRKWWHQVNSGNSRNLAVNIWWFMKDREPPFSAPAGAKDHFPLFIDSDGAYGGYKRRWPEELVCAQPWRENSMAEMDVKDDEYREGFEMHRESYDYNKHATTPHPDL
eukprot:TRINITY_DN19116_c0_g1_i25.p2 TRINITY_DN19116_c0_g1~~TRINITY_DN19116_c0_g1_i25.p2  ORF type:complete len:179 (+),score=28.60 TRINITY_DN19116_c0_g1_i25:421-957(+)